jgi:hypothetical protein
LLLDSTVDGPGGPLHKLEQLQASGEDPTIYVKRVEYADLAEAVEKSPPWIDKQWLRSRFKQLLPAVWATQHLNARVESSTNLFALADIRACQEQVPCPSCGRQERITEGRRIITGAGLDRVSRVLHGDATIWTSVAKVEERTT